MSSENNHTPFQAPHLEEIQSLFPNFSINSFLAQGGMGAVYLATQTSLDRQVAIKILPRELGADESFRSSFTQEARAMAKLNHPNLIGVYDFGEADGMPFIVMEYVHGKSLHDAAVGQKIDLQEAGKLIRKISQGLAHAHEKGILHRDVKPANILLDTTAEPKLGDFGLATGGGEADGLIYGTPGFAAPEVYHGEGDARADLYAAAVSLYFLITAEMPSDPYQAPSRYCGDTRLDGFLAKALRPDPNHRHQNASKFADELEKALKKPGTPQLQTTGTVATSRSVTTLPAKKTSKAPILVAAGIGVAACVIGFLVLGQQEEESTALAPSPSPDPAETTAGSEPPTEDKATVSLVPELVTPPETESAPEPQPQTGEKKQPSKPPELAMLVPEKKPERIPANQPAKPKDALVQVSTFDHDTFLQRGRDFFRKKGELSLEKHRESLLDNVKQLEDEARKLLSKNKVLAGTDADQQREILKITMKAYEGAGRLPSDLVERMPNGIRDVSAELAVSKELAKTAMDRQAKLKEELAKSFEAMAQTYAQGIQKQVSKLREEGNEVDALILEEEARLSLAEPFRFLAIVEGANLPAGRNLTTEETLIEQRMLGEWTCGNTGTSYHFFERGQLTGKGFDKEGRWQVRGQSVEVFWNNGPRHVLAFADLEANPDLCDGKNLSNGKAIKAVRSVPLSDQLFADLKPVMGVWIHEAVDGPVSYTFTENGKVDDGRWNSQGTYQKNFEGGYRVDWSSGKSFNLDFQDKDTLRIRGKSFRMTRQK